MQEKNSTPSKQNKLHIDHIITTQMMINTRTPANNTAKQLHLQVSQEFLGARFDIKG